MAPAWTLAQKEKYLAGIPAPPLIVSQIQAIASNSLNLWVNAMDGMSTEDMNKQIQILQNQIYSGQDQAKDSAAIIVGTAAAVVNVIPVFGQVIGAILGAAAAIIKAVPNARAALGPQFNTREAIEWTCYRGFTRRYMIQTECAGVSPGYGIGGPGTPDHCNQTGGGDVLKNKFIEKVNSTLLNLGKYINIPDILNYFPEGPGVRNPSLGGGDKTPAMYLIEVFSTIPPFESVTTAKQKEIYEQLTTKAKELIENTEAVKQNINWTIVGIGVAICLALFNRQK